MGVGHVPEDPVHPEGEGAHLQGRQRRRVAVGRTLSLSAQARGRFGEQEAARWYERRGFTVLARNWRCAAGEIDLVLRGPDGSGGEVVVFCEVKARASAEFGGPEGAVGVAKQRRVRRLAALWLAEARPAGQPGVRFDVAAVVGAKVTIIDDAF